MSGNIAEYVRWRGDLSFKQSPFNNVDALVFAQLSYNKLEGLMSSNFDETITLEELVQRFKAAEDFEKRDNLGFMIPHETVELLYLCASSNRFSKVKVNAFRSIYSEEECEQFAAVTFTFGKTSVIAFRGTDDYLVGWKEDMNISYLDPIPAQRDALIYFNEAAKKYKHNRLYTTGQSKGGNLALYAGAKTSPKNQKRIIGIYNLDGPGFAQEFFESASYKAIENKVVSIYPEVDIVGMFFKHGKNCTVIKSSDKGILQHNSMSWQTYGNEFVTGDGFTQESAIFERSFNEWCDNLSKEDRKVFSDSLFDILFATGYKTNLEISENMFNSSRKMFSAYSKMDAKTKANIKRIVSDLKDAVQQELPIFNFLNLQK